MDFEELVSVKKLTKEQEEEENFELTERELEVLTLLCHGRTYCQIAKELFIAETTVKTHINSIFQKLNVTDKAQAVVRARQYDLIAFHPERCSYDK